MRYAAVILALLFPITYLASGEALRVEKDGSGDFTIIQDALDAAAPGDSILVGPGRYVDFRPGASTVDGFQFQMIAWITTTDLTMLGAGRDFTTIGPDSLITEVGGLPAGALYIDGDAVTHLEGLTLENVRGAATIRHRSTLRDCKVRNPSPWYAVSVISGDRVTIDSCEFIGRDAITTSSPWVTRLNVRDCQFVGSAFNDIGISIGNGSTDALIERCSFQNVSSAVIFSLSASGSVNDCTILDCATSGINVSSGSAIVRRTWIEDGARFPLRVSQGRLECYDSYIGAGEFATIYTADEMILRDCHIVHGDAPSVHSIALADEIVDLRENWWGTTEVDSVASWIEDQHGAVLYEPILSSPPVATKRRSVGSLKELFGDQ